jgi:hypothetical protein
MKEKEWFASEILHEAIGTHHASYERSTLMSWTMMDNN